MQQDSKAHMCEQVTQTGRQRGYSATCLDLMAARRMNQVEG